MKTLKRYILASVASIGLSASAYAQIGTYQLSGQQNVITTTVPFLTITPDSRSAGMGDAGVALPADANTMHWNPAKLAFLPTDLGFSASYTPWLRKLVPDISLSYIGMYKKINKFSGFGASLRYFSLGDITFTDNFGNTLRNFRPYEAAFDLGYALKLSDRWSFGLSGRYIYSNLSGSVRLSNGSLTSPGSTFAGDVATYYQHPETKIGDKKGTWAFGATISNIGGKITYTNSSADRDFIPMNLKVGGYMNIEINEYNSIGFALDFNKLLVPTRPVYELDSNNNVVRNPDGTLKVSKGLDNQVPVMQGMIQSFYDAPGGFAEELREINPSIGMEYWYAQRVAGRLGYFYEHPSKGNRQYLTMGFGVKYSVFQVDLAYLVPTNSQRSLTRSPLENTLRFTLKFALEKGALKKKSSAGQVTP